jgi:hypothetical protein
MHLELAIDAHGTIVSSIIHYSSSAQDSRVLSARDFDSQNQLDLTWGEVFPFED